MTTEKASALDVVSNGYTLAAFDISFYNLDRPGEKLQPEPGKTVPLTFTVDVSNVDGDTMQVYHLIENEDGSITAEAVGEPIVVDKSSGTQNVTVEADSFSTWLIEGLCSGDTENCSFNEFADKSGFERAELLKELVGEQAALSTDDYNEFYNHLMQYHSDTKAVCFCYGNAYDIVQYGYGTLLHSEGSDFEGNPVMCPWHFSQVSVEDEYTVYQTMTPDEQEAALKSIEGTEKYVQLMAMLKPAITESEWDEKSAEITLSFTQTGATGYQWYQLAEDGTTWTAIDGATAATLTVLTGDMIALTGSYKCVATTDEGTIESAPFTFVSEAVKEWIVDATPDLERIVLMRKAAARGISVDQAIGLTKADTLMWLLDGTVLATLETDEDGTQYLKDARYHIRVAKVVDGLVYPLPDDYYTPDNSETTN